MEHFLCREVCSPRAQRYERKGEIVESQCLNAADLKVMKMFESPSSHGLLCALTERGEAHLFSQVPVSDRRNWPTPGIFVSSHTAQLLTATHRLCAVRDGVHAPREPPLSRRSSAFCHSCSLQAHSLQKLAWSVHARHVLLYLLHQPHSSPRSVHTSNTHT